MVGLREGWKDAEGGDDQGDLATHSYGLKGIGFVLFEGSFRDEHPSGEEGDACHESIELTGRRYLANFYHRKYQRYGHQGQAGEPAFHLVAVEVNAC